MPPPPFSSNKDHVPLGLPESYLSNQPPSTTSTPPRRGLHANDLDLASTQSSSNDPFQSLYETIKKHSKLSGEQASRETKRSTMHKKKLRVSTSSSLHNNNDESDSSSATANANKRLTNISHDLKSSNIRLKAQVASLLNLSNLLLKSSSSGKTLGMVKADAIAFSSILDSNVIQLLGPSPASVNLAGGGESSKDSKGKSLNLDLIGGEDNACVGEMMNFFKGMQTVFENECSAKIEAAEAEANQWKEQFEKSESERVMLLYDYKKMEEELDSVRNRTNEEVLESIYDGRLALANGEDLAVKDDAALIAMGIQPIPTNALTTSVGRTHVHHEMDALRKQKEFLQKEVEDARAALHRQQAETNARECDMSNITDHLEDMQKKLLQSEKDKVALKRKLIAANEEKQKLKKREWSYEKSGIEAKELGEIAVRKAEDILEKAYKVKVAKRRPLVRAKRLADESRRGVGELGRHVKLEINRCLHDVCDLVRDGLFALGEEVQGAAEMRVKYRLEAQERRKIFNKMLTMQGRLRVMARIRPLEMKEGGGGGQRCLSIAPGGDTIMLDFDHNGAHKFRFDKVFSHLPNAHSDTEHGIAEQVLPLALSAMDGYNVCIFAYGQTGSGKTHTMKALTSIICRKLFSSREGFKSKVSVSYTEIYNNEVRDLLRNPKDDHGRSEWGRVDKIDHNVPSLDVRTNSDGKVEVNSISVRITCAEEVEDLVRRGTEIRSTFSTDLNKHSSRSHALLTITCEVENEWAGLKYCGKLNLVDLAGSERLSRSNTEGDRLKETQFINTSLAALGNVMSALAKDQAYIPYRDSKLTMLLSESLSGNSKVLMMTCIKEGTEEASETLCSLQFGARAKRVKLGEAKKNVVGKVEEATATATATAAGGSNGDGQRKKGRVNAPPPPPTVLAAAAGGKPPSIRGKSKSKEKK
ncbi:hypothetical protein TrVE_jg9898 [Triparma verrucosa]|uniref:Kinesin-like protein n=1 Tax=Triparma verrucosa TaxID=1606542 RepID=A0A9W6Z9J1_9STRA|nr:hypothetical protein TrVE_jg9898 [Triparma verrucosa]